MATDSSITDSCIIYNTYTHAACSKPHVTDARGRCNPTPAESNAAEVVPTDRQFNSATLDDTVQNEWEA